LAHFEALEASAAVPRDLAQASQSNILRAVPRRDLQFANILLVAAIYIAGMAVAFRSARLALSSAWS